MESIYKSPFKVYLIIGALALLGILSGANLPISLYPNSSKPTLWVDVSYGPYTADEFKRNYGDRIETTLSAFSTKELEVEKVTANYEKRSMSMTVEFGWGAEPNEARQEIQAQMNLLTSYAPKEIQDSVSVNFWSRSTGFIAISFYSETRSEDELYDYLEPLITPKLLQVKDASNAGLWNPSNRQIVIELNPESLALFSLFPQDIENAINRSLQSLTAGSINIGESELSMTLPRDITDLNTLNDIQIETKSGKIITLAQVASVDIRESGEGSQIFKTNGAKSLILFSKPKIGGNIKKMAEDIIKIIKDLMPTLTEDVKYRVLVDPSEFIRASVNNVLKEVFLAGFLAVVVLFVFIGSFKNTVTAALEIPLSIVLAFIMMKVFDMNLNLISLGGLALAAGMNVDASVVVMENIFRHFENIKGPIDYQLRLRVITQAVREVMLPIIASTISSLVVFAPLAMTSALTYAILGDLAKAVVFSHGLSAIVALILVPTIRLHLISGKANIDHSKSPFDKVVTKGEQLYSALLNRLLSSRKLKISLMATSLAALILSAIVILPNLKKEIIGLPDTDWVILGANTSGNTKTSQMDEVISELEHNLLTSFGDDILYTFVQIQGANSGNIMAKLKDKHEMNRVWKAIEEKFENSPSVSYWVTPWNPAELPIPNPPQLSLSLRGGDVKERAIVGDLLLNRLREEEPFPRLWSDPNTTREQEVVIKPKNGQWYEAGKMGTVLNNFQISDLLRVMTSGKSIANIEFNQKSYPITLKFPSEYINTIEELEAYPILVGEKIVPLRSMVDIEIVDSEPPTYRENGRDLILISGKHNKGDESKGKESLLKTEKIVQSFITDELPKLNLTSPPVIQLEDAEKELNEALKQLAIATLISILLVFFTLLLQFGSFIQTLVIMTAIPFGLLGVLISLWVFKSTLSLNSVLGIILLNGIAVSNSIILVDSLLKYVKEGYSPLEASIHAARTRLRPILITSLTTILGMLPIALGTGEGGKILQPLGIAVAGGLWFSMIFTLFVVPMIEASILKPRNAGSLKSPKESKSKFKNFFIKTNKEQNRWLQ